MYKVIIQKDIDTIYNALLDYASYQKWQENLLSYQILEGQPGEIYTKAAFVYKPVTLIQTISALDAPYSIHFEVDHTRNKDIKMHHTNICQLKSMEENKTEMTWTIKQEVFGFLPRIIMWLFQYKVRQHHHKRLNDFKAYIEMK